MYRRRPLLKSTPLSVSIGSRSGGWKELTGSATREWLGLPSTLILTICESDPRFKNLLRLIGLP